MSLVSVIKVMHACTTAHTAMQLLQGLQPRHDVLPQQQPRLPAHQGTHHIHTHMPTHKRKDMHRVHAFAILVLPTVRFCGGFNVCVRVSYECAVSAEVPGAGLDPTPQRQQQPGK